MKKVLLVALTFLLVISAVGCAGSAVDGKAKEFSSDGMTITLTDNFVKKNTEGYTLSFDSKDVAVLALQEKFSLAEGFENLTLEEYANAVIENNPSASGAKVKTGDGLTYFEYKYTNTQNNITYYYYTVVFKSTESFWMVQFATPEENEENFKPTFIEWAKSAEFSS